MKKLVATLSIAGILVASSATAFANVIIPTDMDRSQIPQRIEFGTDTTTPSDPSFTTMATGESILLRAIADNPAPYPLYEYSATGVTDPKSFLYVASVTTSLFHDNDFIGQSDQALGLAGFDAEVEFLAESTAGGYWEAFSNHTITNGSDFFSAWTVDGENY
ncbi:hypothetical protein K0T92_11935 [Paenibacillus oenotherae]|uniref:Uncharacterized protein n=1 Tax=Paenibacillus oenotherae TaxID=1435645 RepID=A0ABS7D694_9BACL|nr:hypothetical protein [Paenibacillus oenotherae]MBW7475460.1 hypothetical protein [Paenibacillus oenotherae]